MNPSYSVVLLFCSVPDIFLGVSVKHVNPCRRGLKVFAAQKSAEVGKKWRFSSRRSKWPALLTEHPGFQSDCLDVWVLEMAYYAYSHPYGTDNHEAHNYICYSLQTLLASLWRNQLKLQAENSLYQLLFVNVSAHSFS